MNASHSLVRSQGIFGHECHIQYAIWSKCAQLHTKIYFLNRFKPTLKDCAILSICKDRQKTSTSGGNILLGDKLFPILVSSCTKKAISFQIAGVTSISERAIVLFNRNLPNCCHKTSLGAFVSWITGMALTVCAKRNAHLIRNFFVVPLPQGGHKKVCN